MTLGKMSFPNQRLNWLYVSLMLLQILYILTSLFIISSISFKFWYFMGSINAPSRYSDILNRHFRSSFLFRKTSFIFKTIYVQLSKWNSDWVDGLVILHEIVFDEFLFSFKLIEAFPIIWSWSEVRYFAKKGDVEMTSILHL